MKKILGMALILTGAAAVAMAGQVGPEIDPGSAGSALALLAGAALVIRARRRN
jgi:MYXO-CTERM domain-containing protein